MPPSYLVINLSNNLLTNDWCLANSDATIVDNVCPTATAVNLSLLSLILWPVVSYNTYPTQLMGDKHKLYAA